MQSLPVVAIALLCHIVSWTPLSSLFFIFTAVTTADAPEAKLPMASTAPRNAGRVNIIPPFFISSVEMAWLFFFDHFTHFAWILALLILVSKYWMFVDPVLVLHSKHYIVDIFCKINE